MKKLLLTASLFTTLTLLFTSCLKDKGFDNGTYGINDPDTQPPGVGFPLAVNAKNTVGLEASNPNPQVINNIVWVNLESGSPAKSDVTVVLVANDGLRTAYNTATGGNILSAAGFFTMPLTVIIPAGATGANIPITVPTTVLMSPNSTYGVGLTISSVTGGYIIADNLKNLLVEITVKNKYDGVYSVVSGWIQRNTGPGTPELPSNANFGLSGSLGAQNPDVVLATAGSNRVQFIPTAASAFGFTWAPGSGIGGIDAMYLDIDPGTNNTTAFSTGVNTTMGNFGGFTGAPLTGVPGAAPGPYGPPSANKYDPATRTFHLAFHWNPTANVRQIDAIIKYKRAR